MLVQSVRPGERGQHWQQAGRGQGGQEIPQGSPHPLKATSLVSKHGRKGVSFLSSASLGSHYGISQDGQYTIAGGKAGVFGRSVLGKVPKTTVLSPLFVQPRELLTVGGWGIPFCSPG